MCVRARACVRGRGWEELRSNHRGKGRSTHPTAYDRAAAPVQASECSDLYELFMCFVDRPAFEAKQRPTQVVPKLQSTRAKYTSVSE